jgi:hypothetical protein
MGTELKYLEESSEETRVGSLLSRLANGLGELTESAEPWCPEAEPGWVAASEEASRVHAPKTWQVVNSNSTYTADWVDQKDGIKVKWADLASEGALVGEPRASTGMKPDFRPDPKLVPGVGQDGFRSTAEEEADWQAALAGEYAFATATAEGMGAALDNLVSSRLGGCLHDCIEVLERELQSSTRGLIELPPGAAVLDVVWELHRELEWNTCFKKAMLDHLGLHESISKKQLLESLVANVASCVKQSKRLGRLRKRFQSLVQQALDSGLELEVFELEEDDPFARLLLNFGVRTSKDCHQDIICQSLDAIGC